MALAERIVIPRCIGCGAMHEFERCAGGCHDEHLELVAAGELDAAVTAARLARARIELALPVLRELAQRRPAAGEWQRSYESLARDARSILHAAGRPSSADVQQPDPQPIGVWRCPDCGAVDAPQECLGICIWRRFEWVRLSEFEAQRAEAERLGVAERQIFGLLGRAAFSTPHARQWRRSWQALSLEARSLLEYGAGTSDRQIAHV